MPTLQERVNSPEGPNQSSPLCPQASGDLLFRSRRDGTALAGQVGNLRCTSHSNEHHRARRRAGFRNFSSRCFRKNFRNSSRNRDSAQRTVSQRHHRENRQLSQARSRSTLARSSSVFASRTQVQPESLGEMVSRRVLRAGLFLESWPSHTAGSFRHLQHPCGSH